MKRYKMMWDSVKPEFKKSEFDCKCGCGTNNVDERHMEKLYVARNHADIPFIVNSGCRCAVHNKNEGGTEDSSHLSGYGTDISCTDSHSRFLIVAALIYAGFTRILIYEDFIHADTNPSKTQEIILLM